MIEYKNVPRVIGMVLSKRMATLHELETVYGAEDLYNMIEILVIDAYNENILSQDGG